MATYRTATHLVAACSLGVTLAAVPGCGGGPKLVPVAGTVTLDGEPLEVVTFLQTNAKDTLAVAETDDEGNYLLAHLGRPGAAAAKYKVSISYLVGTDGTVYGLAPRSGLAKPYGLLTAKELLPPEWSDRGVVTRVVEVTESGGVFDFDVDQPLLPPPEPPEPVADAPATEAPPTQVDDAPADEGAPPSDDAAGEAPPVESS